MDLQCGSQHIYVQKESLLSAEACSWMHKFSFHGSILMGAMHPSISRCGGSVGFFRPGDQPKELLFPSGR